MLTTVTMSFVMLLLDNLVLSFYYTGRWAANQLELLLGSIGPARVGCCTAGRDQ